MKDTPALNNAIIIINEAIENLAYFTDFDDEPFVCASPESWTEDLKKSITEIKSINIETIKSEFIDTLEDYNSIFFQRKLFEFKLGRLLAWKHEYDDGVDVNEQKYQREFIEFTSWQTTYSIDINTQNFTQLRGAFIRLSARVTLLKQQVKTMLSHYQTLGDIYLQEKKLMVVPIEQMSAQVTQQKNTPSEVYPASKKKTDIIKILSAMYDAKMFADAEGKPLTNKQKMMEAFGEFLGDDFSAYSTSLSQAKNRDRKIFMKPFTEIEKAAERYLEE